ncbi:MAG: hypothetical protein K2Y10_07810 [Burkholderiaceae bacterium]|nr:hypothetical protein [Burkholderiaceae bacterium]MBY0455682.1 hypothetical protein [Burkholderiaceae bacterium]
MHGKSVRGKKINSTEDDYQITPAGVLIMLAYYAYDKTGECPPEVRDRNLEKVNAVLSAARIGGFMQADVLETILSQREISARTGALAVAACNAAGQEALVKIFGDPRALKKHH